MKYIITSENDLPHIQGRENFDPIYLRQCGYRYTDFPLIGTCLFLTFQKYKKNQEYILISMADPIMAYKSLINHKDIIMLNAHTTMNVCPTVGCWCNKLK